MTKSPEHEPPVSPDSLSLWDHQRKAVEVACGYVAAHRRGLTRGSALIHLPTGTGKSGVIAVLGRAVADVCGVLVITPRVALREQLAADVSGRFFRRLDKAVDPARLPKCVEQLRSKPSDLSGFRPRETVFLATIQSLHNWFRRGDDIFKMFREELDLILIDEGHCEPAAEWSETIRNLPQPKVLFTATPYRNDLKLFDIDYAHSYGIPFEEAVEARFIRSVELLPFDPPASPDDFVDQILGEYEARFKRKRFAKGQEPRVIIRCEAADRIRLILAALEARGRACVGIHETFKDDPGNRRERKTVPRPEDETAIFWVHQFKLLEGIDDPRFRMLAIFDRFTNTRELIQQVGRILRNPGRKARQVAYLLDHSGVHHHRLWSSYLAHDRELRAKGIEETLMPGQKLFESLLGGQPASIYLGGLFRRPLDPADIDPLEDLQVPASANVVERDGPLQCAAIIQAIEKRCAERDLSIVGSWTPDARTCIVMYVIFENSPYLRNSHFLESRLAITMVREAGGFAFVLDTGGALPEELPGLGDPVKQKRLKRLFKSDQRTRLTQVSIKNSNLAADVVRARAVSAFSIGAIVPYADDNSGVCTRVEGVTLHLPGKTTVASGDPREVRRYIGFRNARVSDYSGGHVPISDYFSWVDDIAAALASKSPATRDFARYADDSEEPSDCTPVHVLLDLTEVLDRYETSNHPRAGSGNPMDVTDLCSPVEVTGKGTGTFVIDANGSKFEATISYDPLRSRYVVGCSDLESFYRPIHTSEPEGVVRFLNRTQSFRVLPKSSGYFFTQGQFFRPSFRFGPDYDDDQFGLFSMLHAVQRLGAIGDEKGKGKPHPKGKWPIDTVFGLIDSLGRKTELEPFMGKPKYLICDDMQTEAADFILADEVNKKVAFIHAKAQPKASIFSASNLQVVCGQGIKNAKYLAKHNELDSPPNHKTWDSKVWSLDGVVRKRIRRGSGTGPEIWSRIRGIIRDPYSTCEVWLVVGKTLSKQSLHDALTRKKPAPEAVQAAYLLFSAMTYIQSVGARLRVFCSP